MQQPPAKFDMPISFTTIFADAWKRMQSGQVGLYIQELRTHGTLNTLYFTGPGGELMREENSVDRAKPWKESEINPQRAVWDARHSYGRDVGNFRADIKRSMRNGHGNLRWYDMHTKQTTDGFSLRLVTFSEPFDYEVSTLKPVPPATQQLPVIFDQDRKRRVGAAGISAGEKDGWYLFMMLILAGAVAFILINKARQ